MISVSCKCVVSQSLSILNSVKGAILYELRNIELVEKGFSRTMRMKTLKNVLDENQYKSFGGCI